MLKKQSSLKSFFQKPHWPSLINWPVTLFMIINPIAAVVGSSVYFYYAGWSWALFSFTLIFAAATNLAITAGYHRLFAHKSYEAHPVAKIIYLLIGASAWQGSALKWSSDHRRHHSHVDTQKDPYNIHRGFWFSHMGWLFLKETVDQDIHAPDLEKNKWFRWQNKYYNTWAIATGFVFPMLLGWLYFGHFLGAMGGLFVAGSLRIALTQQSTFFVNSLCHTLGSRTYCTTLTARDSWFVAVLTHGEGYHNFHHKFQLDYRNGIRWYQWDPTKWVIQTLSFLGLAYKLRTIPTAEILKARLQVEAERLKSKGYAEEHLDLMKAKLVDAQVKIRHLKEDYAFKKQQYQQSYENLKKHYQEAYALKKQELGEELNKVKAEIAQTQAEFQLGMQLWRSQLKAYPNSRTGTFSKTPKL
ncbi:MAG: fatty acid desaturase [Pseudobdellovibrionaceae bacterium]